MVNYLIMCRSLTYAQRTASALERAGITARIMRAPASVARDGCGYCIKVSERQLSNSLIILKRVGLTPKHVYVGDRNGAYQEVGI